MEWWKSRLWKTNMATQHCQKIKTCFRFAVDSLKGHLSSSPVCKRSQEVTKSSRFWGIRTGLNHINYLAQVSSIKTHYEINDCCWVNMQSTHSPHRTETATHWHLRPHPCQLLWQSRLSAGHWASVESWEAESSTLSSSTFHALQAWLLAASSVREWNFIHQDPRTMTECTSAHVFRKFHAITQKRTSPKYFMTRSEYKIGMQKNGGFLL